MSNEVDADMTRLASIAILKEHCHENSREADRYMTYTVYVNSTPTPAEAHDAVKIVEKALKDNAEAKALFHHAEAKRFQVALEAAEAIA